MKIEVVYICPANSGDKFISYAWRFLQSYHANPPGIEHGTTIVCNGSKPSEELYSLFRSMPECKFFEHDNSGYDIGAFQRVSRSVPCDMMVFFGSSAYVNGNGWLARMVQAFEKNKHAQYGSMGNRGNLAVNVYPHIRTTGFWMSPAVLNSYPFIVNRPEQRHPFEHGKNCFTEFLKKRGVRSIVATWKGEYDWADWDSDPNGFHRGNQSSLLSGDRICESPYFP